MSDFKINLIKDKNDSLLEKSQESSNKKLNWKKFFIYFFLAGVISFVIIILASIYAPNIILSKNSALKKIEKENSLLNQFYRFIPAGDYLIKKDQNRVNILLLGVGGANHPGGLLADTTMLVSFNFKTKEVAMISIPRDLFVPIPNHGWQKINTLNSFGETTELGNGAAFTAENISQLFEIPIHYYARIDFEGFKKIIDDFGGLNIYVEKTFYDPLYPDRSYKKQKISFIQGWQHFDGEKALNFSRSRYGNNGEGSDFARTKRQQKIIVAFKEKFLSFSTLINPQKITAIYEMLKSHLKTNLNIKEVVSLMAAFKNADTSKIQHFVFDTSNYLYPEKTIAGAFILNPKAGDFKEMSLLIQNIFDKDFIGKTDFVVIDKPRLIIQNGTDNSGLANKVAQDLKNLNYKIVKISNADHQNYEKTIIYDLCFDQKSEALAFLQKKFDAIVIPNVFRFLNSSPSTEEIATIPSNIFPKDIKNLPATDFLIILGKNAMKKSNQ
ncbi:LCP family protein [Candidatus Kuenenbacteria bacterium]|nr:LCP family protein [Candidatus Kuenenbacteria bacterium]